MKKPDWKLIASDITAGLTMLSMIPYDKDSLAIINQLVPSSWIPWVIKAGIASTLALRLWHRYFPSETPGPDAAPPVAGKAVLTPP